MSIEGKEVLLLQSNIQHTIIDVECYNNGAAKVAGLAAHNLLQGVRAVADCILASGPRERKPSTADT